MNRFSFHLSHNWLLTLLTITGFFMCGTPCCVAQDARTTKTSPEEKYGVWISKEDESGKRFQQMRLRVYPKAAALPAFKHRLIPAAKDRVDGNSALFYLKAMGFNEQHHALEQLMKLQRLWREQATEEDRDAGDYPPYAWYNAAPESLPMDQVKQYLQLHAFQPDLLYDAARRTRFEHDRAMDREPNPIGYLLPSIQQHRELARVQNVRCRFAIAEGRIDDAVEIVGQMMAMGRHLGSDEFLVSCLVGAAIHRIGVDTGFTLSQQPETPNLYWAIAACPDPAIDLRRAFATEREFLLRQIPLFNEVTEKVRPLSYWTEFIKRLSSGVNDIVEMTGQEPIVETTDTMAYFQKTTAIARDYPTARDFLKEVAGIPDKQLDQYPKAQVVFLAIVKYYEFAHDEGMKQYVVPYANRPSNDESELMKHWRSRFKSETNRPDLKNSLLPLADILVPSARHIVGAAVRADQTQNLWQTVEALRMTAAENGGQFPESLKQLTVPAPLDPATNQPFEYELDGQVAVLRTTKIGSYESEIRLELADQDNPQEKIK